MRVRNSAGVAAIALGVVAATALGAPQAGASTSRPAASSRVMTTGLDDPFGLANLPNGGFVVAENKSGQVTYVSPSGAQRVLVSGAPGVAGVAYGGGKVYSVIGGPDETGRPSGGRFGSSRVLRTDLKTGRTTVIANLLRYELRHNPDGQKQFVKGKPVDSLSNPFSMTMTPRGLLIADGGANDVLKVNPRSGRISTFFVPHTVTNVPACRGKGANANPGTKGCDPVPTGVTLAKGSVWVSTLGAEAPRAGRVYKLNPRNGHVRRVWGSFTAPTGVAVGRDGSIYVSQVFYNAPQGAPPPGFNPASVGRIIRVSHGHVSTARVTMPVGLKLVNGGLYSTSWSVASFLGIAHAGRIVRVERSQFH